MKHASAARQSNEAIFSQFLPPQITHQSVFVVPRLRSSESKPESKHAVVAVLSCLLWRRENLRRRGEGGREGGPNMQMDVPFLPSFFLPSFLFVRLAVLKFAIS